MTRYVTKEQYRTACSVDLADWLMKNHPSAVRSAYGSVLLRADEHVSVKMGFHGYLDFRTGRSGNAVDYLMDFLGYDYPSAVTALTDGIAASEYVRMAESASPPTCRKITLPPPTKGPYSCLFAFLTGRSVPTDVIRQLVDDRLLYQSEDGNNCVFVNPQRDYCEIRGTNTFADRRCRRAAACNDFTVGQHQWCSRMDSCPGYKRSVFHGCRKTRPDRFWYFKPTERPVRTVYVCEAAIDAVSLYVLHRLQGVVFPDVYVSIGGTANQKTIDRLKTCGKAVLAVDNDDAGKTCIARNPDLPVVIPVRKDWNDDLKAYSQGRL